MREAPTNTDDVIDSRDVIARIDELESELQANYHLYCEGRKEIGEEPLTKDEWLELEEYDDAELTALQALRDEAQGAGDWRYGATLIRDDYFEDYAQQLAEDLGAIDRNVGWPACHIDWEAAADSLKMDYRSVDFDGVTYWVRS